MTDATLVELAERSGVPAQWQDVHGREHAVGIDTLRAVLAGIGIAASNDADIRDSLAAAGNGATPTALLTAETGQPVAVAGRAEPLRFEMPGYHAVEVGGRETLVAVAPARCAGVPPGRPWGMAAQLYSLRREGDGGIGDFAALGELACAAARHGADALAISPVHAQFSADPNRFSPYSPSSRIMFNVLHADAPAGHAELEAETLVDWPTASTTRLTRLRAAFAQGGHDAELAAFRAEQGDALEAHARFETLHAHFFGRDAQCWHWSRWPAAYRDPANPSVTAFAREHAQDVAFHAWLQMRAHRGLAQAQAQARGAGMRIGLIADLAVGADGGGSQVWSRQDEMLRGLSVGAPPDLLNTRGQNWGLTTFSPHGLRRSGFDGFIAMLRAALSHAGGVRIDHAMGLQRLWLVPDGADASQGAFVSYPLTDLLRLVALESHRHDAIVVAEDLGTVAAGFQDRLAAAGILGMRVLWFERDADTPDFRAPRTWSRNAAAMSSTHDLATLAGWWQGRDLMWRERIGLVPDPAAAQADRAREREAMWRALQASGAAAKDTSMPNQSEPGAFATPACVHVASAACDLALLPIEDVLGVVEQPNLPGTLDEHPNWRRRLEAPAAALLDAPDVAARLAAIAAARTTTPGTG